MSLPLVITVPMPPPLTNASGRSRHWRTVHQAKVEYWDTLDLLEAARQLPARPARPLDRVTIASRMTLGGAMDDDNALARHKWLLDWLVRSKYLAGDRRTNIRWAGFPEQVVTRKAPASIELRITEGMS